MLETANVANAATVGQRPWWVGGEQDNGQWQDLGEGAVTAAEMLAASGNNWEVKMTELRAVEFPGEPGLVVPNTKAVLREDTKDILGVRSDRYEPIQNAASFSFFDEVVGEGQAVYHTSGALGRGEKVWILAKLPHEIYIRQDDRVDMFMLLVNAHDGSMSFRMFFTPIRIVCQNTFTMAVRGGQRGGGVSYRLSHLRGVNSRMQVEQARQALGLAGDHVELFKAQAGRLAETPLAAEELEGLLQRVLPVPVKALLELPPAAPLALLAEPKPEDYATLNFSMEALLKRREAVRVLYREGRGNNGETRWDAFNAVAEFTDYQDGWDAKRTNSLLFGNGAWAKQKAWDVLTADQVD